MPAEFPVPSKARVLLLEDDPASESSAAPALRAENYQVFLAGNCRQAVEISRAAGIDLLVLNSALRCEVLAQNNGKAVLDPRATGTGRDEADEEVSLVAVS